MTSLNWQMRAILPEFRDNGRLNVLTALLLHANIRLRAYPGMDLLCTETAYALEAVTAAKRWLLDRGAIVLVPHRLRVEDERRLPPRQHVYQLTGIIADSAGAVHEYLYLSPEARADIEKTVAAAKVSAAESSAGRKFRQSKLSTSETKGSSSSLSSSLDSSSGDPARAGDDRPSIYKVYEDNIGLLTPIIADALKAAVADYPAGWVEEAIAVAVLANKRSLAYVQGILNRWSVDGKDSPRPASPPLQAVERGSGGEVPPSAPQISPFRSNPS